MVVLGSVLWTDATHQLTLRSTAITDYIVPEVAAGARGFAEGFREDA